MKRAALYARTSTANQENEETIENQLMAIRDKIAKDGNVLLQECTYQDAGYTGTMLKRPALDQLRSDAKTGSFEVLYFYDRGRLARKYAYQEVVLEEVRNLGIETVSLRDINGDTPEDQLMGSVMGIFHEYERVKISERFRLGKIRKVSEGHLLGYNPKYGYDYLPIKKTAMGKTNGSFTVNEKEAQVVRMIFEWVGIEGLTLRAVRMRLLEMKIPPPKNRREIWTSGPIVRLLKDSTYIGDHYYNKTEAILGKETESGYRRIKNTGRRVRPKEEWLKVNVPRIISDELFNKVQKRLNENKKYSRRNNRVNKYLLVGLVACSCGCNRTGDPGANGNLYYRCTDRLRRYPLKRECHQGSVSATILDALAWDKVQHILSNPELLSKQASRWLKKRDTTNNGEAARLNKQLSNLMMEEQRYVKAYGGGYMSESIYKERMEAVIGKRQDLQQKLSNELRKPKKQIKLTANNLATKTAEHLKDLSFTDKQVIVRQVISKVIVDKNEATIWGCIPLLSDGKVGLSAINRNRRFT